MRNGVTRSWKFWSDFYAYFMLKKGCRVDLSDKKDGIRVINFWPIEGTAEKCCFGECGWIIIEITRNNAKQCEKEMKRQLEHGIFASYIKLGVREIKEKMND